ncbi:hypothetical protein GH733_006223 [Mirounga leonina]|nr:hypothetical protein GH733_006223 [Mirounga leonina]
MERPGHSPQWRVVPGRPQDLTLEKRMELENTRPRKPEVPMEIQRPREVLSEAMGEVEGLEAKEGS